MSLDVYLREPREPQPDDHVCNCEHCDLRPSKWVGLFGRNTTHNHNKIADAVGIYKACWRPDENGITHASQLIGPLSAGLALLEADPDKYKHLEPGNGWGSVAYFTEFVREYLAAAKAHPNAVVEVSR